jgi:L-ascorbate metabolism protein UlaG (beta-lactamase superfamily)
MNTKIRFLGFAAFEITNSKGQVILIDPFINGNRVSPLKVNEIEQVNLVLVTHLAEDHLGDTAEIVKKFECPVVCGPEVMVFLEQQGVESRLIHRMVWGMQLNLLGIRVRAIECHHTSFRQAPDGQYLNGPPLSYILYADPGVRIYHSGDTAIFSDLRLIGELYRPNIGLMCACSLEDEYLQSVGMQNVYGNEMNGDEGALAAMWLGLEYAIICHYMNPDGREDVKKFVNILNNRHSDEGPFVKPLALIPGEIFEYVV